MTRSHLRPGTHAGVSRPVPSARSVWLPTRPGAWALLLVPYAIGTGYLVRLGGFEPVTLLVLLAWLSGFLSLDVAALPAVAQRVSPVQRVSSVYAAVCAASVLGLVVARPVMVTWLLVFVPLAFAALITVRRGRERSLLSGAVTTLSSSMVLPMTVFPDLFSVRSGIWPVTLLVFLVLFGTVLAVTSLRRLRDDVGFGQVSVMYHITVLLLASAMTVADWVSWTAVPYTLLLVVRAAYLPHANRTRAHGRGLRPRTVDAVETALGALLLVVALL